jgi:cytochrome c biogenesis protein ResB
VAGRVGPLLVHAGLVLLMVGAAWGSLAGQRQEQFLAPGRELELVDSRGRSQITVGNHHFGTLAGKDVASGQTDARSTPCDDTDFIGKTHGYPLML